MSPVFADIVLKEIIFKVEHDLGKQAKCRKPCNQPLDDTMCGVPIIMAYVNGINAVIPLEYAEFFLKRFQLYGAPLGVPMNIERTQILTSTHLCTFINRVIAKYFAKNINGRMVTYEVTDGLQVSGTPISPQLLCQESILRQLENTKADTKKITQGFEDFQTMLQMFKICTIHKISHLYESDVLIEGINNLSNNWHLWSSNMSDEFIKMTSSFLAEVTGRSSIPDHAMMARNMLTNRGGLCI